MLVQPEIAAGYLAAINGLGLIVMALDKLAAQRGARRTPERTLLTVALAGGALGVLLGMRWFRHKTRHTLFTWGVPALLALNAAVVAALLVGN